MPLNQRPHRRFLPTYATLVGVPALALFVILRVGEKVARSGPSAPAAIEEPAIVLAFTGLRTEVTLIDSTKGCSCARWSLSSPDADP